MGKFDFAIDDDVFWIGNRELVELDEGRTPLHMAAESCNLRVLKALLSTRPEFATKVDVKGVSPLHLASANGHIEVVRRLLNVNPSTGLLEDNNGNTPLHVAADSDQIEVAKLLISQLQPGKFIGEIKQTANLQICVIRCGPESLEQIIQADPNFLNGFDDLGNTLLHTATLLNNLEMVRYLVGRDDMCIARNKYGLTASEMVKSSSEGLDNDTKEILTLLKRHRDKWEPKTENFLKNIRNCILVVASLIACVTFRAGLNPPGGVFQEDKHNPNGELISPMGTSVIAFTNPYRYVMFSIVNTLAFVSSMCIILLLISGIHSKQTVFMWWLVTVGMRFTITAMGYFYFDTVQFTTPMKAPRFNKIPLVLVLCKPVPIWVGLTIILLLLCTNLYTKFFKKIVLYANGVLRNNARSEIFQKPLWLENQDDADQHDNNDTKEIPTLLKRQRDKRNAILVAAVPIIAYLVAGGVLLEGVPNRNGDIISPMGTLNDAIINYCWLLIYSLAFIYSLRMLITGIRLKRFVFMWLVIAGMWFTLAVIQYYSYIRAKNGLN